MSQNIRYEMVSIHETVTRVLSDLGIQGILYYSWRRNKKYGGHHGIPIVNLFQHMTMKHINRGHGTSPKRAENVISTQWRKSINILKQRHGRARFFRNYIINNTAKAMYVPGGMDIKSPISTTWIPPKDNPGRFLNLRKARSSTLYNSALKRCANNIRLIIRDQSYRHLW